MGPYWAVLGRLGGVLGRLGGVLGRPKAIFRPARARGSNSLEEPRRASEAGGDRDGRWRGLLGWQNLKGRVWHAANARRGRGGLKDASRSPPAPHVLAGTLGSRLALALLASLAVLAVLAVCRRRCGSEGLLGWSPKMPHAFQKLTVLRQVWEGVRTGHSSGIDWCGGWSETGQNQE